MSERDVAWSAATIAHGIRHLRIHRGLTQQGLAERMGVTQAFVSRLEDPTYRAWSIKTLVKVAWALQARLRVQFERNGRP